MIDRAALYFATFDDLSAAQALVAHRPLAFRAVAAAVRAGVRTVYLPASMRDTPLGAAVAASPRARAAVVWLKEGGVPDPGPLLLVPAVVVIPAEVLRPLLAGPPGAGVADPEDTDTPALVADAALAQALGTELAGGRPVGEALARAPSRPAQHPTVDSRCVLARDAEGRARAERQLRRALGSAIDTRLDVHLHRRFSRHVTRVAMALGITPNTVTLASLLVGLVAVWCFWRATPASALAGFFIYIVAVVLDHADGEVARLTLTESRVGEWLDVITDNVVHALVVLAMGVTSQAVVGAGGWLGVLGVVGILGSAAVAKWWPDTGAAGAGGALVDLGSRDGFYALLILFIAGRAFAPETLPWLMVVVGLGSHVYWVTRFAWILLRRRP